MYFSALEDHPLGRAEVSVGGVNYCAKTTSLALRELAYDPYHAARIGARVPRRFAVKLPEDIAAPRRMTARQQSFVSIMLPVVLRANEVVGVRNAVVRSSGDHPGAGEVAEMPASLLIGLAAAVTDWGRNLDGQLSSNPYPASLTLPYGMAQAAVRAAGGISRARHASLLEATLDVLHGLGTLVDDEAFRREHARQRDHKRPDGYRLGLLLCGASPCDAGLAADVLYAIEGAALTLLDRSRLVAPATVLH
ncbi:MAG: hypothetical protein P1U65_02870 [Minwuia sp.]|nr:hypothetical protein [Minwuia sp.]